MQLKKCKCGHSVIGVYTQGTPMQKGYEAYAVCLKCGKKGTLFKAYFNNVDCEKLARESWGVRRKKYYPRLIQALFLAPFMLLSACVGSDDWPYNNPADKVTPSGIIVFNESKVVQNDYIDTAEIDRFYDEVESCLGMEAKNRPLIYIVDTPCAEHHGASGIFYGEINKICITEWQFGGYYAWKHEFVHHMLHQNGYGSESPEQNHHGTEWLCHNEFTPL